MKKLVKWAWEGCMRTFVCLFCLSSANELLIQLLLLRCFFFFLHSSFTKYLPSKQNLFFFVVLRDLAVFWYSSASASPWNLHLNRATSVSTVQVAFFNCLSCCVCVYLCGCILFFSYDHFSHPHPSFFFFFMLRMLFVMNLFISDLSHILILPFPLSSETQMMRAVGSNCAWVRLSYLLSLFLSFLVALQLVRMPYCCSCWGWFWELLRHFPLW